MIGCVIGDGSPPHDLRLTRNIRFKYGFKSPEKKLQPIE